MRKKLKAAIDYLGKQYIIKTIDREECVYRDLHNGFDIEVSGICSRRKSAICVCVWDMRQSLGTIVERVCDITTLIELEVILDALYEKYRRGNNNSHISRH